MSENTVDIHVFAEELMTEMLKDQGVVPRARDLAEMLAVTHPDVVELWLQEQQINLLTQTLRNQLAQTRRHLHSSAQAERILSGEGDITYDVAHIWGKAVHVPDLGYKALGDLTGKDHVAIAGEHDRLSSTHARVAGMHETMAVTVGRKLTRTVYEPEQIIELWSNAYSSVVLEGSAV